jgi:hypothetical protein
VKGCTLGVVGLGEMLCRCEKGEANCHWRVEAEAEAEAEAEVVVEAEAEAEAEAARA